MTDWTFKFVVESILMPLVSLLGVVGNIISIFVLHHKDVKLRKDFVDVLSALSFFDIVFLVVSFFLFSVPYWSEVYEQEVRSFFFPLIFTYSN